MQKFTKEQDDLTNGDYIRSLTDEQLAVWLENFAESYVSFWIAPQDMCDFSHRKADIRIQLEWLQSEHIVEIEF